MVSRVTFGGAALSGEGGGYGFGNISEDESEALLKYCWDAGINHFDTAPIYGFGLSEERLGKYLPKEAMIISKCGVDWHDSKRVNMTNDPANCERMLHQSLRRLNRDSIDIYMVHWPDAKVDIRKTLEPLMKAKDQGKIKQLGLCNTNNADLSRAREICEINYLQGEFNFFNQSFLGLDNWQSTVSMGWGTFDKGILTGRVHSARTYATEDARSWAPWWNKKLVAEKVIKVQKLKSILDGYGISLVEFNLHYSLFHSGISSCLVGAKNIEDMKSVLRAIEKPIDKLLLDQILKSFSQLDD